VELLLISILNQNYIAGRDLSKDCANLNCEYRVVSNPVQAE